MEGSGEIIVDEKLKAIDKRTGRYINVIARTIDNGTSFPIVKYLDKNRKELNYDCVRHLNFDRLGVEKISDRKRFIVQRFRWEEVECR